jgi:hypothetical protein
VKDRDIDRILGQAAGASANVDPALLQRISQSIGSSLPPVRPLPPSWVLVSGLMLVCAAVAVAGASILGLHGIRRMDAAKIGLIFPVAGVLIWLAATFSVREMIPGRPRRVASWVLPAVASFAWVAVFAFLFDDYGTDRFVHQGVVCLTAGLAMAIPAALAGYGVLRRGFAVNALAAGMTQGVLAGLAGVTMLELHCANFQAPHTMLWHTAVLPLSGAAGALLAWAARSRKRRSL